MVPESGHIGNKKLQLRASELRGARDRDEFDLHELALEWGLSEPIVIHDESDIKAKASWKDRLEPFEHQVQNLITFCRRLPVSIIADDVGLGKTISAGLILSELIARRRVNRCLVVCTKLIAPQWIEELNNKFGIDGRWATGKDVRELFRGDATVVATSYESARDYMSEARSAGFDMLILDEAHKLRNLYGSNNPPKMATVIRQTLEARIFKYVLMLTATPMQNRIWDLYSLIDCLAVAKGHENPFGNQAAFAARYGNALKYSGWSSTPAGVEFRNTLRQYLVRARRATVRLAFPTRVLELKRVPATKSDRQLMAVIAQALEKSVSGNGLLSASLGIAMMSSPHALQRQLHNMAERESSWKQVALAVDAIVAQYQTPSKLDALIQICRELAAARPSDWRLVVFTCRLETLNLIVRRLSELKIAVGTIQGGAAAQNQTTIQNYSYSPPKIHVIVSTDSGAEGVNLQAGNVMVNYDLPWNPMVLEQRIGRVQRLGSKFENVVIFNLAVMNSPEDRVVARLLHKLTEISESVGDIESILEAASEKSAGGKSIEEQIKEMVSMSLRGQDVEKQRQLAEDSILNAKRQLEQNEKEINEQLGDLSELHRSGIRPPELSRSVPSLPARDFVTKALRHLGHTVTPQPQHGEDVFAVRYAGEKQEVLAALDRGTWKSLRLGFQGRRVELYQPGQPPFERLIQQWRERAASHVLPLTDQTEELAKEVLQHWLQQIEGACLAHVTLLNRRPFFGGVVRCLLQASNGVDQYEKLLNTNYLESGHDALRCDTTNGKSAAPRKTFDPSRSVPILNFVRSALQQDVDVEEFRTFYTARLQEELPKAGDSQMRRKKLSDDFSVNIEAGTVSAQGFEYEACDVRADVYVDPSVTYQLSFSLIPATGQIINEPPIWEFCDRSGVEFPREFMGNCDYSKTRVVQHCFVTSNESNRRVLPEHSEVCQRTGKRAVVDEFSCSSLSAERAVKSELHCSGISDRLYFSEEMEPCEFTSAIVGIDELKVSDISQRQFRADQAARCCVSNLEGHQSEFATCEVSGKPVLAQELGTSSVSGKRVARTLLHASARDASRLGLLSEIVNCEASGRRVLADEVGMCSETGQTVDSSLLAKCPETGETLLRDRLETCEVSGIAVSPRAMTTCAVTSRRVLRRLCSESAVSSRIALTDECVKCEITDAVVLPGELIKSDCSGRAFRIDEAVVSELSNRTGHCSESVVCAVSGKTLLQDEVTASEVSGKQATPSLLIKCAATGKLALPSELECCEFTGAHVLPDELFVSDYSGKKCVRSERVVSELSGKQGHGSEFASCELTWKHVLLSELIECSVTGKKVLESESFRSAVSGNLAISSLGAKCEITGAAVLPSELVRSDVSGKRFRLDEVVRSEKSGRTGHQSESQVCVVSGRRLLMDELAASQVSGKLADPDCLVKCSVTGVLALPAELVKSEFSGALAVPAEIKTSDSSGKRFCSNEAFVSEVSGKIGHQSEARTCAVTGNRVLSSELVRCEVTSKEVLPSECSASAVSGRLAIKSHCVACEISGATILPDEIIVSSVSGKKFRNDEAVVSAVSRRIGHKSESTQCEYTGRLLLLDEAGLSDYSGKTTAAADLQLAAVSRRRGRPEEFVTCAVTHRQLLKDEVAKSAVSGLIVDRELLVPSDRSGQLALIDEMVVCAKSGGRFLPSETEHSSVSNLRVDRRLLKKSDSSNSLALAEEMLTCAVSGRKGVSADGVICAETEQWIGRDFAKVCTVTNRFVRTDLCVQSQISQRWICQTHAIQSFRSGEWLHPDEAAYCYWNEDYLRMTLTAVCKRTGLTFALELIDKSGQFHLLKSFMSGQTSSEDAASIIQKIKDAEPVALKRLKRLFVTQRNPKSFIRFFRAQVESKWRLSVYYVLIVAKVENGKTEIIAPLTREVGDGTWAEFP